MFEGLRLKIRVHYRTFDSSKGRVTSFRWLGFGWDSLRSKEGFHFVQWGKKTPLRFFCRLPKESPKLPLFILSHGWTQTYSSRQVVIGLTKKPFPFGKFWRAHADKISSRLSRQAGPDKRLGEQRRRRLNGPTLN